jgi:hypothetical protein
MDYNDPVIMKIDHNLGIKSTVRLDSYKIINDTIEIGISRGWNRAHKHTETPSQQHILNEIHTAVMNELCEILKFDEET